MKVEIGVDQPAEVALSNAILDNIQEIADGVLTTAQVMGVLELIKMDLHTAVMLKAMSSD